MAIIFARFVAKKNRARVLEFDARDIVRRTMGRISKKRAGAIKGAKTRAEKKKVGHNFN